MVTWEPCLSPWGGGIERHQWVNPHSPGSSARRSGHNKTLLPPPESSWRPLTLLLRLPLPEPFMPPLCDYLQYLLPLI